MADHWNARPVSGEIMTAPSTAAPDLRARPERSADIIDARFAPVVSVGRTGDRATTAGQAAVSPSRGLDVLRSARPTTERAGGGGPFFLLGVVTLAAAAFWISGGHALVPAEFASAVFRP
ncbi:hypothetical protein [Mesorhizobium sp. L-8-3]|uniref:hypothetical protein n=1 Tax=Mesorhizobium sp. L-8-3 TaxID=2744522 RepID=UPI0019276CFC|nr:hypothetical protein [Mesorhizobium sp. L-8-3]BCH21922.1 hypothetical protein MesoLjLb_17070 [Mesorhizobium sp. L-8-3]